MPLSRPSTMCRARISSRPIRLITSGCKNFLEAVVMDELIFVRRSYFKQAVDDVVGRNAVALGGEVYDQTMAENRCGQLANVFQGNMGPAMNECASFGAEN